MPVDGGFRDVGQGCAQVRSSKYPPPVTTTARPPLGWYHDVAGRRLLLHGSGRGHPAAVFLAGGSAAGLYCWNVQDRAAGFTTSIVVYDRARTGWDDRAELPLCPGSCAAAGTRTRSCPRNCPVRSSSSTAAAAGDRGKRRLYTAVAASVPRRQVRVIDAGHVTMHYRHTGAVVPAIGDRPAGDVPIPGC
jgi:hypothetical protein